MASPQTEKGYIQIATELWEALGRYRLSGEETKVLNVIIRKTYGYKKKEDHISLSQLQEMTGNMKKPSVIRALKKLIEKNVVSKSANGALSVNKNYETWEPLAKKLTPVSHIANTVSKTANASLAKQLPTIENTTKETYTKEIITNVITGKGPVQGVVSQKTHGDPGINEGITLLRESGLSVPQERLNRYALSRLYRKYGKSKTLQAMRVALSFRGQKYKPVILNYLDLEEKWDKLVEHINRQFSENGGVYDATTIS